MGKDFLDEMNGQAKRAGGARVDDFLGTHAVEVISQKNTVTEQTKSFICLFRLKILKSTNDNLAEGVEITHGLLRQEKYPSYFERDSRLWFGVLNKVDPSEKAAWGDFIKEGEGETHAGKQLLLTVTDNGRRFADVAVSPGGNLQ